jgi:hypothetical protein
LLLKDANKAVLRLYAVPVDAFDEIEPVMLPDDDDDV